MRTPGFGLIAWVSALVPAPRRADWRREWEAETAYAWQRLNRTGKPPVLARIGLRLRVFMCVIDALWEGKETMMMTGLFSDVKVAVRSLLRSPGFTAVVVLTLALGIGANTAVFTLVDGVLVRPLPFRDADELVSLGHLGRDGQDVLPISEGLYQLYKERATSLEEVAMFRPTVVNLVTDGSEPERVPAQAVTPGFFQVLDVSPQIGRTFAPEEGAPGGEAVAILSDGIWRSNFGADPTIVGRTVDMNGTAHRVVGVMPPDFGHPDREARVWMPLIVDPGQAPLAAFSALGIARMGPGSTLESVRTEIAGLITRLGEIFPEDGAAGFLAEVGLKAQVVPLKEAVVGDAGSTLWILLGTVGFVLLIACANVANLLLVRSEGRQRELALRVAVGAGRVQVVRTFLSESLVLSGLGAALGAGLASLAVRVSLGFAPSNLPRMSEVGVDGRVLLFTGAVALGCALFFGLFPLLRYGTRDLASQLRDGGGRGATGGRERHRLRNGLVVLQVAMALILLVGSGLMFRSFLALKSVDPGFQVENVLTARITVPPGEIPGSQETADFFRTLRDRVASQPGVVSAGLGARAPLSGNFSYGGMEVEDVPRSPDELPVMAAQLRAEEGFFETLGIPVLDGRALRRGDGAEGFRAAVVDQTFAETWWPGGSAVGRRIRTGPQEEWFEIVGVVGNVHQQTLEDAPQATVYWPATGGSAEAPFPTRTMDIVVRTAGDPLQFVAVLRRELRDLNARIPLSNPRTMQNVFDQATARTSFTMVMLGSASAIALLLGLIGIYGVVSYVVSQRTREIGVRMALGASAPVVRRMVVGQGVALAGAGAALGLLASMGMSRVMESLLYGVSATDPVTYLGVAAGLVGVATLAAWLPALRAAGVDPSTALRSE